MANNNQIRVGISVSVNDARQAIESVGKTLGQLREQGARAGAGMMFFTQALQGMGAEGTTTGRAVGGLTAVLGGLATGGPLGAAVAGAGILVSMFKDMGKESEEAAKKAKESTDKIAAGLDALRDKLLSLKGIDPETQKMRLELLTLVRSLAREEDVVDREKHEAQKARIKELEKLIRQRQALLKEVADAEAKPGAEKERARAAEQAEKERADARKKALQEREALEKKGTADFLERVKWESDAVLKAIDDEAKAREKRAAEGQAALDKRARKFEAEQKRAEDQAEEQIATYAGVGEALAGAFNQGTTAAEGLQNALKAGLGIILDVVEKQILADAAASAAEAYKSQAGIPVVGPFLAAGAAAVAFGLVRGFLSDMPARADGGPVLAGMPYLVGERGPEVIVPASSGNVVPNHALAGGSVNVHVYAYDGPSAYRTFVQNERAIARAQRRAAKRRV